MLELAGGLSRYCRTCDFERCFPRDRHARAVRSRAPARKDSPENYHFELGMIWWKPSPEIVISSGSRRHTGRLRQPVPRSTTKRFRDMQIVVLKAGKTQAPLQQPCQIEYTASARSPSRSRSRVRRITLARPTTSGVELDADARRLRVRLRSRTPMGFAGVFIDVKFNKVNAKLTASAARG